MAKSDTTRDRIELGSITANIEAERLARTRDTRQRVMEIRGAGADDESLDKPWSGSQSTSACSDSATAAALAAEDRLPRFVCYAGRAHRRPTVCRKSCTCSVRKPSGGGSPNRSSYLATALARALTYGALLTLPRGRPQGAATGLARRATPTARAFL
jgi:hypothetical protein